MEKNYSQYLEKSLDGTWLDLIRRVANEATQRGLPLYIVGGAVRDLVLDRPVNDFDLTVEGDAIALARALAAKHGGGATAQAAGGQRRDRAGQPRELHALHAAAAGGRRRRPLAAPRRRPPADDVPALRARPRSRAS